MKQYKILILSDTRNNEVIEDLYLSKAFRKDGHLVKILNVGYNINYDEKFDVILRRNTWQEDKEKNMYYLIRNNMLLKRLPRRNVHPINVFGFQENNLQYLCRLFKQKKKVVPTVTQLKEMDAMLKVWNKDFVLRDRANYIAQNKPVIVNVDNIRNVFIEGKYAVQANLKYKSQVQCHYVGDKLMYAFEYTPSKYSRFSRQRLIKLNEKDRKVVDEFAKISDLKVGVQRLDFIRLLNNDLLLSEIKDTSVHMNLEQLSSYKREEVIKEYKRNIYNFMEQDPKTQRMMIYGRDLYNR